MAFLVKGGTGSTGSNPVLDLFTYISGTLVDVYSAKFKVFDISDETKKALFFGGNKNDVQVFPVVPGDYFSLDVTNLATDPITPGHKLSTGHYYAPFTPDENGPTGDFIIEWVYQQLSGGVELKFCEEFVIIEDGQIVSGLNKIEKCKLFMIDMVSKNDLCEEVEYTDQQYAFACELTVSKWNCTTPCSNVTVENFPNSCDYLLCLGTAAMLMRSTSISQLRNQLTYTDGNIHVGITDKHRDYQNAANTYFAEWERMVRAKKNEMNNDSAWGDSDSPYISVGYSYYTTGGGGAGWGGG